MSAKYPKQKLIGGKNVIIVFFALLAIGAFAYAVYYSSPKQEVARTASADGLSKVAATTNKLFYGLKTVPVYSMSKMRDNPVQVWDINHLLETTEYSRLKTMGYQAYGQYGSYDQPIGCMISPDLSAKQISASGLKDLLLPVYRGLSPTNPKDHVHYFNSSKGRIKYEKLIGYAFKRDESFNLSEPFYPMCRFDFPADLSQDISDDFLTLCSEESRLKTIYYGKKPNNTTVSYYKKELFAGNLPAPVPGTGNSLPDGAFILSPSFCMKTN